jgi:cell wall-associated NlpC family hydrolase
LASDANRTLVAHRSAPKVTPTETTSTEDANRTLSVNLSDPFVAMIWARKAEQYHLFAPLSHTAHTPRSHRSSATSYASTRPPSPPKPARTTASNASQTKRKKIAVEKTYGIAPPSDQHLPYWRKKHYQKVLKVAMKQLGKHYVWGAVGPRTFDCSGFTSYVYRKLGIAIPRTSRNQANFGRLVHRNQLQPGDLVFFDTSRQRRGYVNHVGIYIGGNKFIHASSAKHKVIITSLNKAFYHQRFKWGRRVN